MFTLSPVAKILVIAFIVLANRMCAYWLFDERAPVGQQFCYFLVNPTKAMVKTFTFTADHMS